MEVNASLHVQGAFEGVRGLIFTWDHRKADQNARRHGVSFVEAASAFGDPLSVTIEDAEHSVGEMRYILIGEGHHGRLVVVAHADSGETIRIISARQATGRERRDYEEEEPRA